MKDRHVESSPHHELVLCNVSVPTTGQSSKRIYSATAPTTERYCDRVRHSPAEAEARHPGAEMLPVNIDPCDISNRQLYPA